jgi:hypothetical protein
MCIFWFLLHKWNYISTPPVVLRGLFWVELYLYLYFPFFNETSFTEVHISAHDSITGWLRPRWLADRLPLWARFSTPWDQPASYTIFSGSFPRVKRSGCGFNHQSSSSTNVKKEYIYKSTPPLGLHGRLYGEIYLC